METETIDNYRTADWHLTFGIPHHGRGTVNIDFGPRNDEIAKYMEKHKKHKGLRCLVLNADYTAMSTITWQMALAVVYKYADKPLLGVSVVDYYKNEFILATNGHKYPIPAVIVKNEYLSMDTRKVPFSRKHVFVRDKMTCMYCGKVFESKQLTFDHVIPRTLWTSVGTPTCWNNIVTACFPCNQKKGGKTLKEARMKLLRLPTEPNCGGFVLGLGPWNKIPQEWELYIPNHYKAICNGDS